jgi:hypothetical protein
MQSISNIETVSVHGHKRLKKNTAHSPTPTRDPRLLGAP